MSHPIVSPDGTWEWNGAQWVPRAVAYPIAATDERSPGGVVALLVVALVLAVPAALARFLQMVVDDYYALLSDRPPLFVSFACAVVAVVLALIGAVTSRGRVRGLVVTTVLIAGIALGANTPLVLLHLTNSGYYY